MSMNDVRFGLIGYGLWGLHHARVIAKTAGAKLVAIAEHSEENRVKAKAAHPDAEVLSDYHDLVRRDDIDVVDIVAPNRLHFEMGRAALETGKHLLIEKPMALTLGHCDEMIALAKAKGRVLAVGHEMRLSVLWGKVRQLLAEDAIGTPLYVLIELSRFPYRFGSDGWRFDIRRVGNWILEEPIHFFDLARWFLSGFGEPVSVYARANSKQPGHPELQDNFATIVGFSGGAFAVITETLAAFEHHVTCKVTGTKGAIWAHWSGADARTTQPTFGLRHSDGTRIEEVQFEKRAGELSAILNSKRKSPPWSDRFARAHHRSARPKMAAGLCGFAWRLKSLWMPAGSSRLRKPRQHPPRNAVGRRQPAVMKQMTPLLKYGGTMYQI